MNEWRFFVQMVGTNLDKCEWVSEEILRMAESKVVEFRVAAIINLSQNEWVKFLLCKMAQSKMAEFKMAAIIKLSQNEEWRFFVQCWGRKCEWIFCGNGGNQSWQVWVSLRGKTKMAESKMAEFQDGCHYQVEWEWMSLSQIELVGVRFRVEWECFEWIWEKIIWCLNPRWQNSRWLPSSS